jgi:SAM-dependent methyltransferase
VSAISLDEQRAFWDGWNDHWRTGELNDFMQAQLDQATRWARRERLREARILEVGCGTGWLGAGLLAFGAVTGTDLSPASIAHGRERYPGVDLIAGDFLAMELGGRFDLVLSADAIAHVYDQQAFVDRVADVLRPGGVFLLMTQNPFVWLRKSNLAPRGEGQLRDWPSLTRLRGLLAPRFRIERVDSIDPGGNRGALWWVENRYVRKAASTVIGKARYRALLERALLGRELVIAARRR